MRFQTYLTEASMEQLRKASLIAGLSLFGYAGDPEYYAKKYNINLTKYDKVTGDSGLLWGADIEIIRTTATKEINKRIDFWIEENDEPDVVDDILDTIGNSWEFGYTFDLKGNGLNTSTFSKNTFFDLKSGNKSYIYDSLGPYIFIINLDIKSMKEAKKYTIEKLKNTYNINYEKKILKDDEIEINGQIYNVNKIPNNFTINGGLDLSKNKKLKKLPNNLTVKGSLNLTSTNIKELPKGLTVKGILTIKNTLITKIPKDIKVYDLLCISGSKITKLPDNFTVVGALDITNTNIKELPKGLKIKKYIYMWNTKITKLPDDLQIGLKRDSIFISDNDKRKMYIPKHLKRKIIIR